ncbi:hypothetical protein SCHPADRAFT_915136 [Schizopora paradoxa]|uniref:Protein kinase domain-containing protein n=1 Tax=Schizopora paradoxa TaxID=27342 RepID=A0A0H2RPN5_9AGAM|nr:hypothetical protein SCHPADRAFT_915136 [Schizopora paradoxa]
MLAANAEEAEKFRKETEAGDYDLLEGEIWWRDRHQMLIDHGYQLRPRLRPGWEPSWNNSNKNPLYCEDAHVGLRLAGGGTIDAVRIMDGKDVGIRPIKRVSSERTIFKNLADAQHLTGQDQHIAHILDTFEDDRDPDLVFVVIPLMIPVWFIASSLKTISGIVDLFKQLLEGLSFIHSKNVAHRGLWSYIMLDAPSMFPRGFHPSDYFQDHSGVHQIKVLPPCKASGPVRYYFADFRHSIDVGQDAKHLIFGYEHPVGADFDAPEWTAIGTYDPFRADVFIIGKIFNEKFISKYENIDFLSSLVEAMTAKKPEARPTAADALKRLQTITSTQSFFTLRHQLVEKDSKEPESLLSENINILLDVAFHGLKIALKMPSRTISLVRRMKRGSKEKETAK